MILRKRIVIGAFLLSTFIVSTLSHPFGIVYDEDYVDEDEPMDPPSPFQKPRPIGFAKKSSPAPVLSYPTAFEGAHHNLKATPPTLLQNQKFKIPDPKSPVYKRPAKKPKTADVMPVVQDEIPYSPPPPPPPTKKNVSVNFVTLPPKDETPSTTKSPTPKPLPLVVRSSYKPSKGVEKNRGPPASASKKIRPASSIVSPKYTHHPSANRFPSHTLATFPQAASYPQSASYPQTASFPETSSYPQTASYPQSASFPQSATFPHGQTNSYPHFLPTVEPTYQMVPAAQQEYNFASIGGIGLQSGGSVVSAGQLGGDESGESREEEGSPLGQEYKQVNSANAKDTKYEFMYRVQGDEKEVDLKTSPSDFGHSEAREGDRTWGRYFVKLPDGRVQTVRYWADHTGYHAEVLFQGEAKHPDDPAPKHNPSADEGYSNHSPAFHHRPSFSPLTSEVESSARVQDVPIKYEQEDVRLPASFSHSPEISSAYAHAQEVPASHYAQEVPASYGYAQEGAHPKLKSLYSSKPTFVPTPTTYYVAAASEDVKVVEKPPSPSLPKKSEQKS